MSEPRDLNQQKPPAPGGIDQCRRRFGKRGGPRPSAFPSGEPALEGGGAGKAARGLSRWAGQGTLLLAQGTGPVGPARGRSALRSPGILGQGAGDPEGETQGDPSAERPAASSAPSRLGLSHEAAGDAGTAPPLDVRTDEAARFPEPAPPPSAAPSCLGLQGESPGSRGRSLPSEGSGSAGPLAVGARDPGLAPRGCQAPPSTPPRAPGALLVQ